MESEKWAPSMLDCFHLGNFPLPVIMGQWVFMITIIFVRQGLNPQEIQGLATASLRAMVVDNPSIIVIS